MRKFAFLFGLALVCSSYSFAGECCNENNTADVEVTTEVEVDVGADVSSDSVADQTCPEASDCQE